MSWFESDMERGGVAEAEVKVFGSFITKDNFLLKRRLRNRHEPLTFMLVTEDGTKRKVYLKKEEVLKLARSVLPTVSEEELQNASEDFAEEILERTKFRVPRRRDVKNNVAGNPESVRGTVVEEVESEEQIIQRRKEQLRLKGTLMFRDIRLLDPLSLQSEDPEIRVRKHAVIIDLNPVRALVLHNQALILMRDEDDDFIIQSFLSEFESNEEQEDVLEGYEQPFPIRVMDALFSTLCESISDQLADIDPFVHNTIDSIIHKQSGVTIQALRQCKMDVSKLVARVRGLQRAFVELLQNDRDMALMRLERVYRFPRLYKDKFEREWSLDHDEIEQQLENFGQHLDAALWQATGLQDELQEALNSTTLRLDSARNKLLSIELLVACVSASAALGALVAGLLGMNLQSGMEDSRGVFWIWFSIIVLLVPLVVGFSFFWIYRNGLLIT